MEIESYDASLSETLDSFHMGTNTQKTQRKRQCDRDIV